MIIDLHLVLKLVPSDYFSRLVTISDLQLWLTASELQPPYLNIDNILCYQI